MTSDMGIERDEELPTLLAALRERGADAEAVVWDADPGTWGRFDLAVIRSTWDYTGRLEEFLTWADTAAKATRLWNPAATVRWNSDKHYLRDLAERGVPVVPTRFLEPGGQYTEADVDGADGVVVKPSVSVAARDTARYEPGRAADALGHARMLLEQGRGVLVQPYLHRVAEGERALVFFSGVFSHAIRKGPLLTEPGVIDNARIPHPSVVPYEPTEAELRTARAALAATPSAEPPLFARVDLALDGAGEPVLMELELIEPYLFLDRSPGAVERFAGAVAGLGRG
ncbi:RimK family alpha-L-glutamate ligase [Streptomyces sp. WAC06614]|uniref:ATP-grasp domain-containing protein n=1 Tax=Streptomyces sp. WAC06614 TaxID=2487416 RepID=UPI0021B057A5|nr:hypothetical protein [Streptomyces sp. WAC06614]